MKLKTHQESYQKRREEEQNPRVEEQKPFAQQLPLAPSFLSRSIGWKVTDVPLKYSSPDVRRLPSHPIAPCTSRAEPEHFALFVVM